jgi:hypothetical protein
MKLKTDIVMESHPELDLQVSSEPITFKTKARGSLTGKVSAIALQVSSIPIHLAIPFSRRPGSLHRIAAVGSFGVKVAPFTMSVEGAEVHLVGVLGTKEGIKTKVQGKVCCQSKLKVDGKLYGKIASTGIELTEGDFENSVEAM